MTLNRITTPFLLKMILKKFSGRFKKSSVQNILRKRYGIEFSIADSMINEEDLNIVYTSSILKPDQFNPGNKYIFAGPSLFFKNTGNDFPYEKLKDRTVIYVSLGTLHSQNKNFYELCFDAFRDTEYFVVLSTGSGIDPEDFSEIPPNFLLRQSVPQQQLLEYVDLFVTHAGMNSVNEAICKGVPMLLLPHHFEQDMIATKIMDLGMGIKTNISSLSTGRLTGLVRQMISDPEFKRQTMKYRRKFEKEEKLSHIKAADEIMYFVR